MGRVMIAIAVLVIFLAGFLSVSAPGFIEPMFLEPPVWSKVITALGVVGPIFGLGWMIRTGAQWRMMPNDLPPWSTINQQAQRWLKAGVFEATVHDLRGLLRLAEGRRRDRDDRAQT